MMMMMMVLIEKSIINDHAVYFNCNFMYYVIVNSAHVASHATFITQTDNSIHENNEMVKYIH